MLPQRRAGMETLDREERAELVQVATHPLALSTEQDKEASESEHEHDVDRTSQQVMACCQKADEPEDDTSSEEHSYKLDAGHKGGSVVLPPASAAK